MLTASITNLTTSAIGPTGVFRLPPPFDLVNIPAGATKTAPCSVEALLQPIPYTGFSGGQLLQQLQQAGKIRVAFDDVDPEPQLTDDAIQQLSGAGNVEVPNAGGLRRLLYARSFGNDTTGDGTLANPFRTFQRTLRAAAAQGLFLFGTRYVLDITGIGVEALPDGFRLPPFVTADSFTLNFAAEYPPYFVEQPLTINATPTVLGTITAGQIVSQTADPTTGLITIATTNVYVPNALKGKRVVGSGVFEFATIASNTASDLETCGTTVLTAPLTIIESSAGFTNANPANFDPVFTVLGDVGVALNGIDFLAGASGADGLNVAQARQVFAFLCDVAGAGLGDISALTMAAMYWHNANLVITGCAPALFYSLFEGLTFYRQYGNGGFGETFLSGIFDGCGVIGTVGNDGRVDGILNLSNAVVRNGIGESVHFRNGSRQHLLQNVVIENGADHAIHVSGSTYLFLLNVRGTGNAGLGVKADFGCQVLVDALTDVTGAAGDFKVGGKALRTWVDFRTNPPLKNEADFFVAATSDGSHLQQV